MSELLIFIIIGILILIITYNRLNQIREKNKISQELIDWLKSSTLNIDQKLNQNMQIFNERLDKAYFIINEVQKNIGEFSEIGRSIKKLQEFLNSAKIRGNIGEQILKDILKQSLPPSHYKLQYRFKTGEIVDAVIETANGKIPVDSKFPLDNFNKMIQAEGKEKEEYKKKFISDLKKHIETIAKKYILVEEGTVDYALMYIPSESVYYETIKNETLFNFAGEKRVLPVSPLSFYAYLKAILMSFEGEKIEKQAKEILFILQSIKKDYQKTQNSLTILSKHITNAYNQLAEVSKNLLQIGQKLSSKNLLSFSIKKIEKDHEN